MLARSLADAVMVLHVAFVVFVVLGGLLVLYRRFFLWLHLPAAVWGFLIEAADMRCPLTYLENALRRRAGEAGYPGGFIEHHLIPLLYPIGLTRVDQAVLGTAVVVVNLAVYGFVVRRLRRAASSPIR